MQKQILHYGNVEALTGKPFDPVHAFLEHVPYLVEQARHKGRGDAYSYRGFHVAGAVYAANLSLRQVWQDTAGNLKRRPDKEKVCAEKKLLRRADKMGMTTAVGFVVLGETNRELIRAVTGLSTPTLQLCVDSCQPEMRSNHLVTRETLLVTTGLEDDINQTLTVGQVLDGYDGADSQARSRLFMSQPNFTDWEQRVAAYSFAMSAHSEADLCIEARQTVAQLALSKALST